MPSTQLGWIENSEYWLVEISVLTVYSPNLFNFRPFRWSSAFVYACRISWDKTRTAHITILSNIYKYEMSCKCKSNWKMYSIMEYSPKFPENSVVSCLVRWKKPLKIYSCGNNGKYCRAFTLITYFSII